MALRRVVLMAENPSTQERAATATKKIANIVLQVVETVKLEIVERWCCLRYQTSPEQDISRWDDIKSGCTWIFGKKFDMKIFKSQCALRNRKTLEVTTSGILKKIRSEIIRCWWSSQIYVTEVPFLAQFLMITVFASKHLSTHTIKLNISGLFFFFKGMCMATQLNLVSWARLSNYKLLKSIQYVTYAYLFFLISILPIFDSIATFPPSWMHKTVETKEFT